jgi:phosphatidate cytidylyltransferase
MKTRIITGAVALCVFVPVLILSHTVALPILISLCSVLAVYEMSACIGLKRAFPLTIPFYLIAAGLPFLIRYGANHDLFRQVSLVAALILALYLFAVLTFSHGKYKLADVSVCFFTLFYILAGFNSILFLRDFVKPGGQYVYLTVFIGAWVTDTFAYFCGMLFGRGGKHKLIPDVSPKKTVEGSIGGTVFCILAMLLFGMIVNSITELHANYLLLTVGGLLAAIVAQVGDLCMSVIKRTYGIKDYGTLFPGHGGILDRFDSVLAVSIVMAAFCSFFRFFEVI